MCLFNSVSSSLTLRHQYSTLKHWLVGKSIFWDAKGWWYWLPSVEGEKQLSGFVFLGLMLSECSCHLRDAIVVTVTLMPSLEQVCESVQEHCSYSNPLSQSLTSAQCCPSITFGLITKLAEIVCWPSLGTSSYTFCYLQLFSCLIFASSTPCSFADW